MTPQREEKKIQRSIRKIPLELIPSAIAEEDPEGMWCLVNGKILFVLTAGGICETLWDDPVEHALLERYLMAHPERHHLTYESAQSFVVSRYEMFVDKEEL